MNKFVAVFLQLASGLEILIIFLFLLGGFIWLLIVGYSETLKTKKEFKNWINSKESTDILNIPNLFQEVIYIIQYQLPPCTKCDESYFQMWELLDTQLVVRCTNCKKKITFNIDKTCNDGISTYIKFVNIAYSHNNKLIRNKMLEKINYDFIGLRKNAPLVRAIYFDALSEPQSDKLVNKDERPSRRISQKVKDMVWRRDEGKCVECGSVENLEFDHIIPHSKGGANTYRNVQLLCESCNRLKSAKIG